MIIGVWVQVLAVLEQEWSSPVYSFFNKTNIPGVFDQ